MAALYESAHGHHSALGAAAGVYALPKKPCVSTRADARGASSAAASAQAAAETAVAAVRRAGRRVVGAAASRPR